MSKSPMTSIDRFSSLPDDVACKLSPFWNWKTFLNQASVVSKRCRQLCLWTPSLSFNVIPCRTNARKRAQLMNYIERLLFLRNEVNTLDFRIRWCLESSFDFAQAEYRLLSWLHFAVTCYLKQLVIDVNLKRGLDFLLLSRFFCFKSLEFLMMCFSNGTGILKIPPSIGNSTSGFSSLKFLKMISVRVDVRFGELISLCCKSLEELSLTDIRGTKSITITPASYASPLKPDCCC